MWLGLEKIYIFNVTDGSTVVAVIQLLHLTTSNLHLHTQWDKNWIFTKKKCHNILLTIAFNMNEIFPCSLWLKVVIEQVISKNNKNEYIKGYPKWQLVQIWLLRIFGVTDKIWSFLWTRIARILFIKTHHLFILYLSCGQMGVVLGSHIIYHLWTRKSYTWFRNKIIYNSINSNLDYGSWPKRL